MAKEEKIKVTIKTDGSAEGTSLMINGVDITNTSMVTRVYFSAYSPTNCDVGCECDSRDIYLSWDVLEEDKNGVIKNISYRLDPTYKKVTKGIGKKIGDSTEIQFDTESDAKAYKITKTLKKLEDCIEVQDTETK